MNRIISFFFALIFTFLIISCKNLNAQSSEIRPYVPIDMSLFEEIVAMDKAFFDAYNSCDLDKQASIYADDIEFFHDKGGLMTSKTEIIDATKRNICGKVSRTLIEGSVEVYPINNYGAVQIGYHKFFNNQEPNAESVPSKFVAMWRNENGTWKMAKVISLH